ncbi:uncharacterized protein [Penaeus vannamei]|uniref:uncharacterized protein isoform X2 n=1 Tax=Penaeus vannamei TaxID=6689 RepID=UPI00387F40C5
MTPTIPVTRSLASLEFRQKQQRKKCPRVVVTFRPQPGSSSVFNSPFRPPTSGPPYTATTLPLRTAKYNAPLRLCPSPVIRFGSYSTPTVFDEKVPSHLGMIKYDQKVVPKSGVSWV